MTSEAEAALWDGDDVVDIVPTFIPGNLATKFVEPPFSVLDSRQGRWQARRRAWLSLGIKSELGRDEGVLFKTASQDRLNALLTAGPNPRGAMAEYNATSIFDPVLCELAYRWWAPPGGHVLDPFAGGSVRGIVAAKLGHPYTGMDLSGRQIIANQQQAAEILTDEEPFPIWMEGDSRTLDTRLPPGELYDMVFSCPPYFDLEVYSDDPADLSNMDWWAFLEAYERIIEVVAERLRPGHFAVFVVSEIRGKEGNYRGLVPRTIHAFERVGLHLYNDAVLVNTVGTLALRATRQFEAGRKLGRGHQNVLCFVKGTPERGWSYDRAAPPDPQLDLGFSDQAT